VGVYDLQRELRGESGPDKGGLGAESGFTKEGYWDDYDYDDDEVGE
jgi:hypothetical protein